MLSRDEMKAALSNLSERVGEASDSVWSARKHADRVETVEASDSCDEALDILLGVSETLSKMSESV